MSFLSKKMGMFGTAKFAPSDMSTGTVVTSPVDTLGASNAEALAPNRVYAGEVLSAFTNKNLAEKIFMVKTIQSGTSSRFPVLATGNKADVLTHTAGKQISVNTSEGGEVIITLDDLLYDARMIDNAEAKILDFDITSPYTKAIGYALSDKLDTKLFGLLRTAVTMTGVADQPDGSYIGNTVISSGTTPEARGNALVDSIFEANSIMDENNVPSSDRWFVTTAKRYYEIAQATKTLHKDFQSMNGGIDSFPVDILNIANTKVIWSNNLTLTGDFAGFLFHKDAIGLVKLIGLITERTYLPNYFADLITARYKNGAGVLNAGLVVGVRTVTTPLA